MRLQQKQIDRINKDYPDFMDRSALNELIKREYNIYMVGTANVTSESLSTPEWKEDIQNHYAEYRILGPIELETIIRSNFVELFRTKFPRFFT